MQSLVALRAGLSLCILLTGGMPLGVLAQAGPETFYPPEKPAEIQANRASGPIRMDGKLDEAAWQQVAPFSGFIQANPVQGAAPSFDTEVRVIFDEKNLYIGAFCKDDLSNRNNLRVQNLRRDYDYDNNDNFGIAIDGFSDKRNAASFQISPYGNIRDLQVIDGYTFNRDWDALWQGRTHVTDSGWYAEMVIPWKTIRYPDSADGLGVIFLRNIRRNYEYTTFPAVPRVFTPYRMAYAARLTGLTPPRPRTNVLINPYVLGDVQQNPQGPARTGLRMGGEVKWAINPATVADFTVNTDFAQADVDRQVNNLERFSVLFPERRQFFLENDNLFRPQIDDFFQPYFSRRIGLDDEGNAIPLDGGLRVTHQSPKSSGGLIAMRQRAFQGQPATWFGVGRWAHNIGEQHRVGGMVTYRHDEAAPNRASHNNYTATVDGVFRPNQLLTMQAMLSASHDQELGNGFGGQFWAGFENNWMYIGLLEYLVVNYHPGVGLERFGRDYLMTSPAFSMDLRPDWLPRAIRRLEPGADVYLYHNPATRELISSYTGITPLSVEFQSGAYVSYLLETNQQVLEEAESFLGIAVAEGRYAYVNHQIEGATDQSAAFGASASLAQGGYFDGRLQQASFSVRAAPIPHLEVSAEGEFNRIRDLGSDKEDLDVLLLGLSSRIALNPRLQFSGFFQWNTAQNRSVWNLRGSWEYRPLSYVFLVLNRNAMDGLNGLNRTFENQGIFKLAYLKQF